MDKPKLASCSPDDVFKALRKLGGFIFKQGAKHTKVIHTETGKSSTIPRHGKVNRNLLKDFVEEFLVKELGYLEKDIYKHLWC
ncbi:MAG: type II toxin-antitoxin system HicA family toxin [Candidatus Paceibacterota bacterium]